MATGVPLTKRAGLDPTDSLFLAVFLEVEGNSGLDLGYLNPF